MTTIYKIIKSKLGLLQLAKQLSNLTLTCQVTGHSRVSSYGYKEL